MKTVDFHQHLWPEPFVELLARRDRPPRLRGSVLELAGERRERDRPASARPRRSARVTRSLGARCRRGVAAADSGARCAARGRGRRARRSLRGRDSRARSRFAGKARSACSGRGSRRIRRRVHRRAGARRPRPARPEARRAHAAQCRFSSSIRARQAAPAGAPAWWPAVVEYTAQMQAAYAIWLADGAERWPSLRVVFAILAGGAPFPARAPAVEGCIRARDVFTTTSSSRRRRMDVARSSSASPPSASARCSSGAIRRSSIPSRR